MRKAPKLSDQDEKYLKNVGKEGQKIANKICKRIDYIFDFTHSALVDGPKNESPEISWYFDTYGDWQDVPDWMLLFYNDHYIKKIQIPEISLSINTMDPAYCSFVFVDKEGCEWEISAGQFPEEWLFNDFEKEFKRQVQEYKKTLKKKHEDKKTFDKNQKEILKSAKNKIKKAGLTKEEKELLGIS